ncbi:hypothetical protein ACKWTF_009549 [Chironomus riparius]
MDPADSKVNKDVFVSSKDEIKKMELNCSQNSFKLGEFIDREHENSKDLQCYVRVNERIYTRRLRNLLISIIITLMLIVFVNFGLEMFKTWYYDGYNEYDFDYKTDFWSSLASFLLTLR